MPDARFTRFRPLTLPLGEEPQLVERIHARLTECAPESVVVLPESIAATLGLLVEGYVELASVARGHRLSIITLVDLGSDLTEDLPGRHPRYHYNALVVFTRHGIVHVPQAKLMPQPLEIPRGPAGAALGVAAYERSNLVCLDVGEGLLTARFLGGSDLWLLPRYEPADLACDLLVVLASAPPPVEAAMRGVLDEARAAGMAQATLLVNRYHGLADKPPSPLDLPAAELHQVAPVTPAPRWPDRAALLRHFHFLEEGAAPAAGETRIVVPSWCAQADVSLGAYPITIVL